MWTLDQALSLARRLEAIASVNGFHVALTGGLLYKDGPRKDADFVIYPVRPHSNLDTGKEAILDTIRKYSEYESIVTDFGFVSKVKRFESWGNFDILWPHEEEDNYLEHVED